MIINIHAGHNPAGKIACGAADILNESAENRLVVAEVVKQLQALGHTVYDCTVDNGTSPNDVLKKIVAKCNAHKVDLDISVHFNSGAKDEKGNGRTTGVEAYVYSTTSKAAWYAKQVCNAIAELGFKNRGVKYSTSLYVLKHTVAPAMLIECCFVDDADDAKLYNYKTMATAIVKGITGETVKTETGDKEPEITVEDETTGESFLVKVTEDSLNIRTGAGSEYTVVSAITDNGTYTIVETKKAKDGGTWGKLKSGAGWINISNKYVKRV